MKNNSLNREIWKYFLIFSVVILGFLWIFQVLFLDQYYKQVKVKDIKTVASIIKRRQSYDNFGNIINRVAFDKGVCVEVIGEDFSSLYSSSFFGKGCFSGKDISMNYKYDFIMSSLNSKTYELINPEFNNKTLVYALRLDNNRYAFINTSLEPIDSTINILREQLVIVTIIVLILSLIISYFISNYISSPIVKINKVAKKLAKGDFDTKFDTDSNIMELNELAELM